MERPVLLAALELLDRYNELAEAHRGYEPPPHSRDDLVRVYDALEEAGFDMAQVFEMDEDRGLYLCPSCHLVHESNFFYCPSCGQRCLSAHYINHQFMVKRIDRLEKQLSSELDQ